MALPMGEPHGTGARVAHPATRLEPFCLRTGPAGACPLFLVVARAAYSQGTGASAQQRVIRLVSSPAGQGLARDPRPGLRSLDLSRWLLSSHVTRGEA
jgi:hypothetical protein